MKNDELEKNYKTHYPEAVYSPWDEPPVGQKVRNVRWSPDRVGIVRGKLAAEVRHNVHRYGTAACPTCTCQEVHDEMDGWWIVEWPTIRDGKDGKPLVTAEYPPSLMPVKE